MKEIYISLPSIDVVNDFVRALNPLEGDFELVSDKYVLDARSLMGIIALDLAKPLLLRIYNDCDANIQAVQSFAADRAERCRGDND